MKFAGNKAYFKLRNAQELKTVVEEPNETKKERKKEKKPKLPAPQSKFAANPESFQLPAPKQSNILGGSSNIPYESSAFYPLSYAQPSPPAYNPYLPQAESSPYETDQRNLPKNLAPPSNLYSLESCIIHDEEVQPRLIRRVSSCESICDADLNRSFHSDLSDSPYLSDQDEEEIKSPSPRFFRGLASKKAEKAPTVVLPEENRKYRFQVDTNVVEVDLSTLAESQNIATGDAVFCKSCSATLNIHSKLDSIESAGYLWKCEFCDTENEVNLEAEEIPTSDTMDYMLLSASQKAEEDQGITEENKDISIVFCIDISGSMCVTKPVEGAIQLKMPKKQIDLGGFSDYDVFEQYMEDEHGVTYISRLQCVQAAIDSQIEAMSKATPLRKVGLVTFNNEVTIIGDGTKDTYTLNGDRLYNYQECLDIGKNHSSYLEKTIQDSKDVLGQKLMNLWEGGSTAMGPALLASIGLASKGKAGSKVIICTDGLANIGIGSLDNLFTTEEKQQAEDFYTQVGTLAKDSGLSISVISIEGEECKIESLSKLAANTGGDIIRVDPLHLSNEFANILSTPIIATQVTAKIKIHKGLMFRNESEELENGTSLYKEIGNVTSNSRFTFEYSLRPKEDIEAMGLNLEGIKQLVFQTQIHYTTLSGMRCMRTITAVQETTDNLEEAIQDINFEVIGTNAAIQSANYAKRGDYRGSQAVMRAWKNMMSKNVRSSEDHSNYALYVENMSQMHNELQSAQMNEVRQQGRRLSIHDTSIPVEQVKQMRRDMRDDKLSHMAFNAERGKKDCSIF